MSSKKITLIPIKTRPDFTCPNTNPTQKRRVAAYARVSTDMDEQLTSYEAQISYYTEYIQNHLEWAFVKVYTDEGISGLSTKKREGFQDMVKDALNGKIDLILTKSVSRFARNTVDTLITVRKLKEHGVVVYFEKEAIWTDDAKGELLITIMSSLAQEESRSISENVTWGQRKRFADGKISMPYKHFLGYKKGLHGQPEIVQEEATIVRRIYREFLFGLPYSGIANGLTRDGILTPRGVKTWQSSTIRSILQNEKYKGDALLQKRFTVDFLTKRQKTNEGEVPQYYVSNSHDAIVSDEIFEMVQNEIERRSQQRIYGSSKNFFSGRIFCDCCGEAFTRKVWHSTSKYKRYLWQCGKKYKGAKPCDTLHLSENEIKEAFGALLRELYREKERITASALNVIASLLDTTREREKAEELDADLNRLYTKMGESLRHLGRQAVVAEKERESYEQLKRLYESRSFNLNALKQQIAAKEKRRFNCQCFLENLEKLKETDTLFNEALWCSLIDHASVPSGQKKMIRFHLRSGEMRPYDLP